VYSFYPGKLSQVGAFTANDHAFCFVYILKTKHIGTHRSASFLKTALKIADGFIKKRFAAL
jgi:hypothetical protein